MQRFVQIVWLLLRWNLSYWVTLMLLVPPGGLLSQYDGVVTLLSEGIPLLFYLGFAAILQPLGYLVGELI